LVVVGLEVSANERKGTRVTVQGVHNAITPDEFMSDVYEMNLKEACTLEDFKKKVKLVSKPWKEDCESTNNVVLEGETSLIGRLIETGRVYAKWFSFRVCQAEEIAISFRCYGTDHRGCDCRTSSDVCRRCSQTGHRVVQCPNP